jgi:hypothetical protein
MNGLASHIDLHFDQRGFAPQVQVEPGYFVLSLRHNENDGHHCVNTFLNSGQMEQLQRVISEARMTEFSGTENAFAEEAERFFAEPTAVSLADLVASAGALMAERAAAEQAEAKEAPESAGDRQAREVPGFYPGDIVDVVTGNGMFRSGERVRVVRTNFLPGTTAVQKEANAFGVEEFDGPEYFADTANLRLVKRAEAVARA